MDLRRLPVPLDDYLVDAEGNVYSQKSKITESQYDHLMTALANGEDQDAIADRYEISQGLVSHYACGKNKNKPGVPVRLKPSPLSMGYLAVSVSARHHGMWRTTRCVHTLVALGFHGPCPAGLEVRHLDGNPRNNRADNLRYGTPRENSADMILHGRSTPGSRNGNHKLTEEEVVAMRRRKARGDTFAAIARAYPHVHERTVTSAIRGETWAHVKEP